MGEGFAQVDWSKTYAYALGLGGIYLNRKGREAGGILEEGSEAERVKTAIRLLRDQGCFRMVSGRRKNS